MKDSSRDLFDPEQEPPPGKTIGKKTASRRRRPPTRDAVGLTADNPAISAAGVAHPPETPAATDGSTPAVLTEHTVAKEFCRIYYNQLRFCHDTGTWFAWNGSRWLQNRTKLAFHYARELAAKMSGRAEARVRFGSEKASFAAAVERFAQADTNLACRADRWDADPFLLGTPSETVDLHTGKTRPSNPSDFITKSTGVAPAATAHCPIWKEFLKQATGGDDGLIRFLQQCCGYFLTADTREHAMVFIYGTGGNGKGVFMNTLRRIMGDYCRVAPMETFTTSNSDRHPTELAMTHGARLVCATETDEGKHFAESRIKQLTGGDRVAARFMRQNFFEFTPGFKLVFTGNHRPSLRNVDDAIKRRMNMVPFLFKPPSPDLELEAKLEAEWPEILRWMIEGCLDWQANRLVRPPVVLEATKQYFDAQDSFGRWLAERCDVDVTHSCRPGVLLADYRAWAEENGEQSITPAQCRAGLEGVAGVRHVKLRGFPTWKGISLRDLYDEKLGGGIEGDGDDQ